MSKRDAFLAAHETLADRLAMIDEMETYFDGASEGVLERLSGLQKRLIHEDERIWRPALDEIAAFVREESNA